MDYQKYTRQVYTLELMVHASFYMEVVKFHFLDLTDAYIRFWQLFFFNIRILPAKAPVNHSQYCIHIYVALVRCWMSYICVELFYICIEIMHLHVMVLHTCMHVSECSKSV